jgi:drug/metabolite transporter (DMT)-like permease
MSRALALVLLAAAGCTWGATFPLVKGALSDAGPLTFLALRFSLAAVFVIPLLRARGSRSVPWRAIACGAALFVGYTLQTTGLATTSPARSAFITALSVILVPLFEPMLGLGRASLRVWVGAATALAGLAVLLRPQASPISVGDLLTAGCAVAFACHVLLLQWAVRVTPVARASAVQVITAAALALPAAGAETWRFTPSVRLTVAVLVCAVLATVGAFWVMTAVQRVLSAAVTAVVLALEPVAAALISVAMGEDTLSLHLLGGGLVVIAGVVLASAVPWRRRRQAGGRRDAR